MRLVLSAFICVLGGAFLAAAFQAAANLSSRNVLAIVLVCVSMGFLGVGLFLLKNLDRREDSLLSLAAMLGCFCAGLMLGDWGSRLVGTVRPSISQMILSALSLQGAVLALMVPFLRQHQVGWAEAFGLKRRWGLAVVLGLLGGCAFVPIGWMLQGVSAELLTRLDMKREYQQVVQTLLNDHESAGRAIFAVISVVLVPPAEESFFRGVLYPWIKRAGYPQLALWGTSLAFAATHTNLMSFIPLTAFALLLTLLYESTGNLLAPIAAHSAFNAANMVRLFLS